MLTVIPPAVLLIVALIYLPYAACHMWRIHSAQRIIDFHHSKAEWRFQQREYSACESLMGHYSKFFTLACWIATCCVFELSFGPYARSAFPEVWIDHWIVLGGITVAIIPWLVRKHGARLTAYARGVWECQVARILGLCLVFAFQWELAVAIVLCGVAWIHRPFAPQEI